MTERNAILQAARLWLGTPYLHQASLRGAGCDCLGLVRGVWRDMYGAEPEETGAYTPDWAEATKQERLADAGFRHLTPVSVQAFAAGDVLLFRWRPNVPAKHCAIATSRETMIHAHDGASVCEIAITPFWKRRVAFAFAFPDVEN
ncbi:MAG: NlpC/P60 family protein [Beijerinckiaceae bacterium]|nr:NlpC/P60 family protein [Beijerinckiaceae bacterium]